MLLDQFLKGGNHDVVLVHIAGLGGRHGAGGDPDLRTDAAVPAELRRANRWRGRGSKSYLKLPLVRSAVGRRTQSQESLPDGVGLRQDRIGQRQDCPKEPANLR